MANCVKTTPRKNKTRQRHDDESGGMFSVVRVFVCTHTIGVSSYGWYCNYVSSKKKKDGNPDSVPQKQTEEARPTLSLSRKISSQFCFTATPPPTPSFHNNVNPSEFSSQFQSAVLRGVCWGDGMCVFLAQNTIRAAARKQGDSISSIDSLTKQTRTNGPLVK